MQFPYFIAVFAAVALGNPRGNPSAFCSLVDKLVTAAHQTSQATAFCSSYLHITTSTVTTTVSSVTYTISPSGCVAPAAKRTPEPGLDAASNIAAREPVPNAKPPIAKPSCFKTYTAGALLSSACSCLSIPTGTITSTTTTYYATLETPLTFHLSAAGVGYATVVNDAEGDNSYNVRYGGSLANANNFFVDEDPDHPNLYLDAVPANDISLMYERVSNPGLLYFYVLGQSDSNVENVQCRIEGYPGVCSLNCHTEENTTPYSSGPFDGYTQEQLCSPGNTWWLDQNLDPGCSAFNPVVVPV